MDTTALENQTENDEQAENDQAPMEAGLARILAPLGMTSLPELRRCPNGTLYALVDVGRGREAVGVESETFSNWVRMAALGAVGKLPHDGQIMELVHICTATAGGQTAQDVAVRVAAADGKVYLDLADKSGRSVEIDAEGWRLAETAPPPFLRPKCILPLPVPVAGGELGLLRHYLNVDDGDFETLVVWLLATLVPDVPCPILLQVGEQGSAKTTNARMLKSLLDPSAGAGGAIPANDRALFIEAMSDRVLLFDNVSSIRRAESDMLCRLTTRGGFRTRKLFTDSDVVVFDAMRPILLTAVHNPVSAADLASRCLLIEPPRIIQRRSEREIRADFDRDHPKILGALLKLLSRTLATEDAPVGDMDWRMADFARFARRVGRAAGWPDGSVSENMSANVTKMLESVAEGNAVASGILLLCETQASQELPAEALDAMLRSVLPEWRHKELPGSPAHLSRALKEVMPLLRQHGVEVTWTRTAQARKIHLRKVTVAA
ncbi:MAG: hypothetical protein H6841_06190 [Planctomycetes bacterium]|nr:hypothetical protein [Planctomycetota bacterium]